jgi:capsular polysaccharide transport system permease protein
MSHSVPEAGIDRLLYIARVQRQVLGALILRDIRTRFFGKAWGFLFAIGWPLSHILILLVIYALLGRAAPYGDNAAVWFATGIVPFMAFSYTARFIQIGAIMNRPLLTFPVVRITDIVFSRAIIEVLNASIVIIILCMIFWMLGIDFMPFDPVEASYALLASVLLGLGYGVVCAIISLITPLWVTGAALVTIVLWMTSGVLFVPTSLPRNIQAILYYQPTVHCVEWLRSAYYDGYSNGLLDKTYVLSWGSASLFVGLALERLLRGRLTS